MFEVEALNNTREADAVADVLGDAFTHDPAYRYILAGATDHVSKSNDGFVFKPMVFDALRQGIVEVIHVDGLIGGVGCVYFPPQAALFTLLPGHRSPSAR